MRLTKIDFRSMGAALLSLLLLIGPFSSSVCAVQCSVRAASSACHAVHASSTQAEAHSMASMCAHMHHAMTHAAFAHSAAMLTSAASAPCRHARLAQPCAEERTDVLSPPSPVYVALPLPPHTAIVLSAVAAADPPPTPTEPIAGPPLSALRI